MTIRYLGNARTGQASPEADKATATKLARIGLLDARTKLWERLKRETSTYEIRHLKNKIEELNRELKKTAKKEKQLELELVKK